MNTLTRAQQIINLVKEKGAIRPRDLISIGIPHMYLQRLLDRGILIKSGRGIYILSDTQISENFAMVEVCHRIPHGVICLLSSLNYHNIGTQTPYQVWIAISGKAWYPKVDYPPLRVIRFSGLSLSEGVEEHNTPNGTIRVYSIAKTIVDCFRYRNKIGLDVGLEALQECRRKKLTPIDEIWHYSKLLRSSSIIQPYIESLS